MGTPQQVVENTACVLRALGAVSNPTLDQLEALVLPQVVRALEPIKNATWEQGNPVPADDDEVAA